MTLNPYKILYILLFVSTISYVLSRIYFKRKNNITLKDSKELNKFREVEIALLGEDFTDIKNGNFPFNVEKNIKNYTLPLELIIEGKVVHENLECIKKDYSWLIKTINKKGFEKIEDISYAVMDSQGKVHVE
jgi:uncharacterized membrane protein YcaP (DUF421 family)